MNRFTTLDQSKKLAEVWKDAETESCYAIAEGCEPIVVNMKMAKADNELALVPRFDLSDILERLPAEIEDGEHPEYNFEPKMSLDSVWYEVYRPGGEEFWHEYETLEGSHFVGEGEKRSEKLLTALYNLTIWLHEQKYIGEGQNG